MSTVYLNLNSVGDFILSSSAVFFNSSSSVGETRCVQVQPVDDTIVEGDEVMTFLAVARNPLDVFTNNESRFLFTIHDDDGILKFWLELYFSYLKLIHYRTTLGETINS